MYIEPDSFEHDPALRQQAVMAIQDSYRLLKDEPRLSPDNTRVTKTLTHLVRTLTKCQSPELARFLLTTPTLAQEREYLPALCAAAECEMEKYWAKLLAQKTACDLAEFWYFPEYSALCAAELSLLKQKTFETISFLGSGALPMTAFLLARHFPQSRIVCVDYDAEACDLSQRLTKKLGLQHQVSIDCQDALAYEPTDHELVICASLLQGRQQVYRNLEKHETALIVRDAEGPYQYLYKAAEMPCSGFRQLAKTEMNPKCINTSRYFEWVREAHL